MSLQGVQEAKLSREIDDPHKMIFQARIWPSIAFYVVTLLYTGLWMS